MLVTKSDIRMLRSLSAANDLVPVETIPEAFKPDFQKFFFGKTLTKKGNVVMAFPNDVRQWVRFMINKYNDIGQC